MGSMTRNRCVDDSKPGPEQVKHYSDRAADGTCLIITEGTFVDWSGCDWEFSPVMITEDHARAWQKVVGEVHSHGGKIYLQAWHLGRCQNENLPIMREKNQVVLAPSKVKAEGGKYHNLPGTPGYTENITEIERPSDVVDVYRRAAMLARSAGFDGIELLAQGGYLPQQFLNSRANLRKDDYGGSVENRCRFTLEVVDAIADVFEGPEFVCVKVCPTDFLNDSVVTFEEMKEVYSYLIEKLVERRIGIINISRRGANHDSKDDGYIDPGRPKQFSLLPGYDPVLDFGPLVKYPASPSLLMANQDYTVEEANQLVGESKADLISFARPFICNPDLVSRIRHGIPFAQNDRGNSVHYGPYTNPGENYNDWPVATIA
ncbi:hypothetical protein CMUS01_08347 [Colletotrichum musicola]|uniref:NADH:flavin oxidoreductase/NADH oxidase N-terminal domain-containing protein n=1 Tax=Colletotrichum musicola TaxID=2175873 RepID=A0A8H6KCZ8_9PEZI|nr:hypothetical protein CMUS01_08347 [Colletotrichum musicola]